MGKKKQYFMDKKLAIFTRGIQGFSDSSHKTEPEHV